MQKEAEERVREMQSRARLVGENTSFPSQRQNPARPSNNRIPPQSDIISAIIKNPDSDKIIILALLWLLWNEHADSKLLLALLYLLL